MNTEKDFENYLNTIKDYAREEGFDSLDTTFVEHLRCRYFGQKVVIARSERILLREIEMFDLEAFYAFSDAETEPVLKEFLKESREASEEHLRTYRSSMYPLYDYGIWVIEDRNTKEVLGLCGFGQREFEGEMVTDLGYYIRPENRRQGIATEAIELALAYGEGYAELPELYAFVRRDNVASIKLLSNFGFDEIQMWEDHVVYRLVGEEHF